MKDGSGRDVCEEFNFPWTRVPFKLYSISIIPNNNTDEFIDVNSKNSITSLGLISQKDILSSPLPLFSQKFGKLEINITCVEECMTINEENT